MGFPHTMPKVVLQDYATEALSLLPDAQRRSVKTRLSLADNKFSLVFCNPTAAADFVATYMAKDVHYEDPDDNTLSPLIARTGRPLAIRRRGAATHPLYEKLRVVLDSSPATRDMVIVQKSYPKNGIWYTDFFGQVGDKLSPFITATYNETPHTTTITDVVLLRDSNLISPSNLAVVKAAALT